ncbi:MAG TPA: WYL domain-containing protein [Acidimicrobiales bacterium]|nr:WYL domain-containing protein [Acidimicrobiales bacterium]
MASKVRADRLERLTNLVLALLSTSRSLSLREIGSAVAGYPTDPVALRQAFERDKRTLRENGIPLTLERFEGGDDQVGYRILPEHYYLPDLGLSADEQLALGFALAAVRLEGLGARDALAKIGSPDVPDLPPVAVLPSLPALGSLQEAIRRRAVARFGYHGRPRAIDPYGLCFRNGAWYLVGRERGGDGSGDVKTFRVDRIQTSVETGDGGEFESPSGLDLLDIVRYVPWQTAAVEATEAVVEVDGREARGAVEVVGQSAVESRLPDGGVRLRFRVGDDNGFVSWVIGLGDAAVVISPPELRDKTVARLREFISTGAGNA